MANARGYRSVIVMPETQSQEKKDMLRLCGADLRLVPAAPYSNPTTTSASPGALADELGGQGTNGAVWANQFDNTANRDGHYRTTGRRSGTRPTARSMASPVPSAAAAPWPAWRVR